jgi:hypothetical protein
MKFIYLFSTVIVKIALLESFGFYLVIPKAQAGGIEQSSPELKPDKPAGSIASTSNWGIWKNSYWLNGNICREKSANLICLTP